MTVVPTVKKLPDGSRVMVAGAEQPSVALAVPRVASLIVTPQAAVPGPVAAVTAGGAVIVGGVLSTTVTVAVQQLEAPRLSVTVRMTWYDPRLNGPVESIARVIESPESGSTEP